MPADSSSRNSRYRSASRLLSNRMPSNSTRSLWYFGSAVSLSRSISSAGRSSRSRRSERRVTTPYQRMAVAHAAVVYIQSVYMRAKETDSSTEQNLVVVVPSNHAAHGSDHWRISALPALCLRSRSRDFSRAFAHRLRQVLEQCRLGMLFARGRQSASNVHPHC